LLPVQNDARILDVGAGPLTWLGKKHEGKSINITAIDPLADEYDRILEKYRIHPLVRTEKLAAENLMERFPADSFGLVFARNCIDHSFDPEKAILQMINVVETGGYVLLEHRPNEAENENYSGLHQWNFSMSPEGNFLISSKNDTVDMTRKYQGICIISSEIVYEYGDIDWLIVRIKKK
jgi:SAM-dependent methyltransferase